MHVVLKDVFTLASLAVTHFFVVLQFRPIFGEYLTRHVLLGVPLFGVLVRYRLHYVPSTKSAQGNGGEYGGNHGQPGSDEEGLQGITYPAMLRRTYKVEGLAAFYKGTIPALIPFCIAKVVPSVHSTILGLFVDDPDNLIPADYKGDIIRSVLGVLCYFPVYVLSIRAITVPHHLPLRASVPRAMRALFTPSELKRPFAFTALIRGVAVCLLLHRLYTELIYQDLDLLIESWISVTTGISSDPRQMVPEGSANFTLTKEMAMAIGLAMGTNLLVQIGTAVILCPLEMIATRLSTQRVYEAPCNGGKPEVPDETVLFDVEEQQEAMKESSNMPSAETSTSTMAFRSRCSTVPYDGFLSCLQLIIQEEGRGTLWRGWWITMIGLWFLNL